MSVPPNKVIRVTPPTGGIHALATNRDYTTGAGLLTDEDLSVTTSGRLGVWMGHRMIVGEISDHGEVADEAAMLTLHDWPDDPHTRAVYHYVAPGDSCTRADDPGWRWHCMRGHGTALADWERRPLGATVAALREDVDSLLVDVDSLLVDVDSLLVEIDQKQPVASALTAISGVDLTDVGLALLALDPPTGDPRVVQVSSDGTVQLVEQTGGTGTLPIASASTLGGIKVGSGLSINATTGVLSVTSSGLALALVIPFLSLDWLSGYSVGDAATLDGGASWAAPGEAIRHTYPGEATDRMDYAVGSFASLTGGSVTGWANEASGWAGAATVEVYT